jgi:hypothetical protein
MLFPQSSENTSVSGAVLAAAPHIIPSLQKSGCLIFRSDKWSGSNAPTSCLNKFSLKSLDYSFHRWRGYFLNCKRYSGEATSLKRPIFFNLFGSTRKAQCLTAHVAHTKTLKLLISLYCRSHPSWAQYKIYRRKTVFYRSSSLFSSVQCAYGAHERGYCIRPL